MSAESEVLFKIKRPSLFLLLTETGRALFELSTYYPFLTLKNKQTSNDGHPVLVLPGFMASDVSTGPLRKFVKKLGYETFGWGLGRNYANEEYLQNLLKKVEIIYKTTDQKVSLIGWSLGGVFARQLAKEKPEYIRQVITLGSPFGGILEPNNAAWVYNLLTGDEARKNVNSELINDLPKPAPVPTTAIYTKEDGIVPWEVCLEKHEDKIHQNIQVRGSHLGLGVNPIVLKIIEDRLRLSEENWAHYKAPSILQSVFTNT